MIYLTLWNTIYLTPHQAQSPTEVNLLVMSEESSVQSTCIPIVFGSNHHTSSSSPQDFLLIIILSIVTLHHIEDATTTERITILIQEATTSASVLKAILVIFGKQLRLASCHLRMGVHKLYQRSQPMMRNFYITVEQDIVLRLDLLQGTIVALGKAEVLFQDDGLHLRKLRLQQAHRLVGRTVVCHPHLSILT